ncbi:hypothetical protein KKHLCK_16390 [Candidatus Electrothrix laxa]
MNNLLNKNSLIGALIILLLVTSWWGQSETGANKQLTRDKQATEAQLATVEAEAADTRQALQEKTAALAAGEAKLSEAKTTIQLLAKELSTKKAALITLDNEEKVLLKKINDLEQKIKELKRSLDNAKAQQTQAGSEQQENIQKTVAAHKETQTKIKKAEAQIAQLEKKQTELKKQAEARIAQLQKKQNKLKAQAEAKIAQLQKKHSAIKTEAESLQAQVIGFEKVVEERSAALTEVSSELNACKVNTKVLLSKITEQENAQQGMEEKIHLMIQDLSTKAAHKDSTPVQQEQPAQAE